MDRLKNAAFGFKLQGAIALEHRNAVQIGKTDMIALEILLRESRALSHPDLGPVKIFLNSCHLKFSLNKFLLSYITKCMMLYSRFQRPKGLKHTHKILYEMAISLYLQKTNL